MEKSKAPKYSDIKCYYDTAYQHNAEATFPVDHQRYQQWLKHGSFQRLHHQGASLDIGCGAGFICQLLSEQGYQTYGVDICEQALTIARQNVPHGQFVSSQESGSFDFGDDFFELVTCFGVLEHLKQPHHTISESFRILKPNALAIFIVPNSTSPYFWFNHGTGQVYEKPRSLKEWRSMFMAQGFKVIDVQRDPGPSLDTSQTLQQKLKYLANAVINVTAIELTYQFIFYLQKDEDNTL
ncbi:Methyltransferase type 11 [Shewanella halifaxensis HAW-EB4]|uniref:Methyltransferase type 11 n=1 Tax=Shewanella halifaxensis (strain HAW-EB4) TaxID=458817 RepID=B0TVG5_SHEHH|nr:class I SAM-dependent methyltransferase [Shewanella halifaxensis]ABZ76850.1 Methyltransferase type 11 [Shewanella halifaxensis HAW-EB4]